MKVRLAILEWFADRWGMVIRSPDAPCEPPGPTPMILPDGGPQPRPVPVLVRFLLPSDLSSDSAAELNVLYGKAWPPAADVLAKLPQKSLVIVGVRAESTNGGSCEELLMGFVDNDLGDQVEATIQPPVTWGNCTPKVGHGIEPGARLRVPKTNILAAGTPPIPGTYRTPVASLESDTVKPNIVHVIRRNVPYDLILPYQPKSEYWSIKGMVNTHGRRTGRQQIELTGPEATITLLDSAQGNILAGRWKLKAES